MPRLVKADSREYILDMLAQLAVIAKRDGLDRLSIRITTVVAAENADLAATDRDSAGVEQPQANT